MRDSELAVSIVDGDPRALAEAYRKYGDLLWSYCRSMLRDGDHAAEAVLDTFVIASSRLEVLHSVGRLRAWLYAVARCECLRRLRTSRTSAVDEAPRLRQAAAVLSTGEQRQFRAVLRAAFGGLDDAERDVMTMVWHGLDVAEVAVVLGVSRSDAYALFTRARDQLEESVGVLLVGWSGRVDCRELDAMLTGHDRRLTPDLRVRLMRHLSRCGTCAQRHRREMRPAVTLGLSMGALLAEANDARAVAGRAPSGLWEEVYRMTSDKSPEAVWRRAMGGRRVSFGEDGFPKALAGRDGVLTGPRLAVAAVGTVAVAATATGFAATTHHVAATSTSGSSTPITAVMPEAASTSSAPIGTASHAAVVHGKTITVRPGRTPASANPSGLPAAGYGSPSARGSAPAQASSARGTGTATSTPTSSSTPSSSSGSGSPESGSSGSASPSSPASAPPSSSPGSASPGATQGTLSVSTSNIALAVGSSASFTLTANGGPVNWSISVPSGLLGSISVSQASGSLAAGQSVTIVVQASGLATLGTPLTISPGGQTVTVDISLL